MALKIGDKCKVLNLNQSGGDSGKIGQTVTITEIRDGHGNYVGTFENGSAYNLKETELSIINKTYKNMNIIEKFALTLKGEPEKSFTKAGITDSSDMLTADGQKIFLSWLLKKNGASFKTEVVDDLLKDEECEK